MTSGIINREVFVHDPLEHSLQNDGVSKVESTAELHYELATFVCEGEYEKGLDRILSTYLSHLDQKTQPSAWVSGFYGSGKSHLVKILEALWTNDELSNGQCPRDIAQITDEIREQLIELSSQARRAGGLWSAAGMLSESGYQSVRMLILGTVYKAAGLPSDYGRARFRLWVRERRWEDEIARRIEAEGFDVEDEFNEYLVSPIIADAVVELSGSTSQNADTIQDAWTRQFDKDDISIDDFETALREVLRLQSDDGKKVPLTVLVLDEAQQYIGDNAGRAQELQQAVERIQTAFDSKVLVVATGQAALNTTPNLQKLQGRFTVNVMLSDKDVEQVVRQVVLRKKPAMKPAVQELVKQVEGEIDSHLQKARIGPRPEDKDILAADYPLLPARNRFWSSLLHELDPTGTSGQLRTQLRVVHSANVDVARKPLGHVIPADFVYEQLQGGLQQSGTLPRDVVNLIADQDDGSEDGRLRARLIKLIFLIERLPQHDLNATGVTATADTLADLLVDNLKTGSDDLRRRIPDLLGALEEDGRVLRGEDGAYGIQTGESLKWQEEFQRQRQSLIANSALVGEIRTRELHALVEKTAKPTRTTQGRSSESRSVRFHFDANPPEQGSGESTVWVWVRDAWNTAQKLVREDARMAGDESPLIHAFVPLRQQQDIQLAIATHEAAENTLERLGGALTDPLAQQAASAMRARMDEHERRYTSQLTALVADAQVYQGGGAEVDGATLRDKIQTAFERSLQRLFPRFEEGDNPDWRKVLTRATEGNADALKAIGHAGDDGDHPVIREIRRHIPGEVGTTWAEVRRTYKGAPYGWPNDTIDGAIAVLVNAGAVTAMRDNRELRSRDLNRQQAASIQLVGEQAPIGKMEFLQAQRVMQKLNGDRPTDDDVRAGARDLVRDLIELQRSTGGAAPRPMPGTPGYLLDLENQAGNQLVKAIAANADRLVADIDTWRDRADEIERRWATWTTVERLASHASSLDGFADVEAGISAIRDNRQLLDNPDPVPPIRVTLGDMLREALQAKFAVYSGQLDAGLAELKASDEWLRLNERQQAAILAHPALRPMREQALSSDRDLLVALDQQSLAQWDDKITAVEGHLVRARADIARMLEPRTVEVSLEKPLLRKPADVDRWIDKTREALLRHVNDGHPVQIT